jgi:hypothetical protein
MERVLPLTSPLTIDSVVSGADHFAMSSDQTDFLICEGMRGGGPHVQSDRGKMVITN